MRPHHFAIFALLVAITVTAQSPPPKKTPAEVMREIRLKVLSMPPSQMSRKPTPEFPHVDGIIMDWPIQATTVSLMASSVGDGSIYTTGTFGVFGGIGYDNVRSSAQELVKLAEKYYSEATPTKEYPYPTSGRIFFYLICYDGVRVIDSDASTLNAKGKYSDLFAQAQVVIKELQEIAQQQRQQQQPQNKTP